MCSKCLLPPFPACAAASLLTICDRLEYLTNVLGLALAEAKQALKR